MTEPDHPASSSRSSHLPDGLRYRAFLSYRTSDRHLAVRLHRALEQYRVPKALVGKPGDHGPVPSRIGAIFRDRDDARTSEDIENLIAYELSKSQQLIVLCTPAACAPESWVHREIEIFRQSRPGAPIHAVIGAGEPPACFPKALLKEDSAGQIQTPLAADMRPGSKGGHDGFTKAVVRVAAGLLGVKFDDLWRREQRRKAARLGALAGAAAGLILTIGGMYAYADQSHFVREQGDRLAVFKGLPSVNPPGYPQLVWVLSESVNGLVLPEGSDPSKLVVATPPGVSVVEKLRELIRRDHLGVRLLEEGDLAGARDVALAAIDDPSAPFEEKLNAHMLFAEVAAPEDAPRLRTMLSHERTEIRRDAIKALFRVDPAHASDDFAGLREDDREDMLPDLIHLTKGPCTAPLKQLLESGFHARGSRPENNEIIDAALRTQCELSIDALEAGSARPNLTGNDGLALYTRVIGKSEALAARLLERLAEPDLPVWRTGYILEILPYLRVKTCEPALAKGLTVRFASTRIAAMKAIDALCEGSSLTARILPDAAGVRLDLKALQNFTWSEDVDLASADDFGEAQIVLRIASERQWKHLIPYLRDALERSGDDNIRREIIPALTALGERTGPSQDLATSNSLDIRQAIVERERQSDERAAAAQLIGLIGDTDEFYTSLLGRIPLEVAEIERIRPFLRGNVQQRRHAACVLAMQGETALVSTLLVDPDAEIRESASGCAPFNREAEAIVSGLPASVGEFPINARYGLGQQVELKKQLQDQLDALPADLRAWRIGIVDATPSGFGIWDKGMRYWIDEQQYQAGLKPPE